MFYRSLGLLLLSFLPSISFATWQLAGSSVRTSGSQANAVVINTPSDYQTQAMYVLKTHQGQLADQVQAYATAHHWHLIWMAKRDYALNLATTISGPRFSSVLDNLLSHYPLRADYNTRQQQVTVKLALPK